MVVVLWLCIRWHNIFDNNISDHHFHYGYHIYAAAVLAKLDPDWVRRYHERVVVMIRVSKYLKGLQPATPC